MAIGKSKIEVVIGANTTALSTGLAQARAKVRGFASSVLGVMGGAVGRMGIFALGALGITGFVEMARNAMNTAQSISDMSKRFQIGTRELQTLQRETQRAGASMGNLYSALNNLEFKTQAAVDGNENYRDSFKRLGIDLLKFANMSPEARLEALGQAYIRAGRSQEAFADIANILGTRNAPALREVLTNLASDGFDKVAESAEASGEVMSFSTIEALRNASQEIEKWKNKIVIGFGGFLAKVGSVMGVKELFWQFASALWGAFEWVERNIRKGLNYIGGLFDGLAVWLKSSWLGGLAQSIAEKLMGIIEKIGNGIADFVGLFSDDAADAVRDALKSIRETNAQTRAEYEKNKNRTFGDIMGDAMSKAERRNMGIRDKDLFANSIKQYAEDELEAARWRRENSPEEVKKRAEEERLRKEREEARRVDNLAPAKSEGAAGSFKDSYLAGIGGGGNIASRYNVAESQLKEAEKTNQTLERIERKMDDMGEGEMLME